MRIVVNPVCFHHKSSHKVVRMVWNKPADGVKSFIHITNFLTGWWTEIFSLDSRCSVRKIHQDIKELKNLSHIIPDFAGREQKRGGICYGTRETGQRGLALVTQIASRAGTAAGPLGSVYRFCAAAVGFFACAPFYPSSDLLFMRTHHDYLSEQKTNARQITHLAQR